MTLFRSTSLLSTLWTHLRYVRPLALLERQVEASQRINALIQTGTLSMAALSLEHRQQMPSTFKMDQLQSAQFMSLHLRMT